MAYSDQGWLVDFQQHQPIHCHKLFFIIFFFVSGMFDKAQDHLRAGLQMLDIDVPVSSAKLKLKFKVSKELDWSAREQVRFALPSVL